MASSNSTVPSAWSSLRIAIFRTLWIASLASNIGTWMQNVGAAWLMTSLTDSPFLVALLQAATSLPIFLVGLPAGAIADIFDRRRLLLVTQTWMLLAAAGLSITTALALTNSWLLLAFTFALGLGAALNAPAWQALIPDLVPRSELPEAMALNGLNINLARAVGPALAGVLVVASGPEGVFLLNAASFLGVIVALFRWRRPPKQSTLPAERVLGAMRAGVRYLRHAPELQIVLIRAGLFISCGSALWALMPVIVRKELGLGASGYGILLGCVGAGSVAGATVLPKIRQRFATNRLLLVASILFAAATFALAYVRNLPALSLMMFACGIAWIAIMSTLNVAVQTVVPTWVRARALSLYQLVFQGGMAVSSIVWGAIAAHSNTPIALAISSIGLIVGLLAVFRYRLSTEAHRDLSPSLHWAEPIVVIEPKAEDGPVLVILEYTIRPEDKDLFSDTIQQLRQVRHRDGAIRWSLWSNLAQPERYIETFIVESWAEHKRQHERVTVIDLEIEQKVRSFIINHEAPKVSHLLYRHLPNN
ncbi:MAG: MFS transporter [Leptolyngbya sp. BL-A-14]